MDDSRYGAMSVSVRRSRLAPSAQGTTPASGAPSCACAAYQGQKTPFFMARWQCIADAIPAQRVAIPLQSQSNDAPGQSNKATGSDRQAR